MNVFEEALGVLDKRGWTQGKFAADEKGGVCLMGAIGVALTGDVEEDPMTIFRTSEGMRAWLGAWHFMHGVIKTDPAKWNDTGTEEDARLALKWAAEQWDEQHE